MINHVRTLLLNREANELTNVPGADYVDPGFRRLALPAALQAVRDIFVPPGIDITSEVYTVNILCGLIAAPELEHYTRILDSRITYDPHDLQDLDLLDAPLRYDYFLSPDSDIEPSYTVQMSNLPQGFATAGLHTWKLTKFDERRVRLEHNREADFRVIDVYNSMRPREARPVELIKDYLHATMVLPSGELTGEFTLTYRAYLPLVYANITSRVDALTRLFSRPGISDAVVFADGTQNQATVDELRMIWTSSMETAMRLGALLLSWALQAEHVRLSRGDN